MGGDVLNPVAVYLKLLVQSNSIRELWGRSFWAFGAISQKLNEI
jgi:hypothetical protein